MNKARLRWACKRGMLELDLILMPYYETKYDDLTQIEQEDFAYLLTQEDTFLYSWFMETQKPNEPRLDEMVRKILAFNRAKEKS